MCFGHSDLEGERSHLTRGKFHKQKLKRGRSPTVAENAQLQDPRKLSKLDSTASTLANNQHTPSQKPTELREAPKPGHPPSTLTDNDSMPIEELHSLRTVQERNSLSSARTLDAYPFTGEDTPIEHHAAYLESHHACEKLYPYGFSEISGCPLFSALQFQFLRSTKLSNDELAVCFDLISTTSQQDYKASSLGWRPAEKMEEMKDKEMMYLVVRQKEGYIGIDKISEADSQESSAMHAGAILGFLSFKFDFDDPPHDLRQVLYIFELHLDDRLRGQGLGGRMIQWVESQARLVKIRKMMLTVFTSNHGARRLYEKEGFEKDACSPEDRVTRRKVIKADYIIMSKEL